MARLWLEDLEIPDGRMEDAQLLVSELVTNSLRHAELPADGWIEVSVRSRAPALCVMVCDPGRGLDAPDEPTLPPPTEASGRGLYIVSRIADRWGVSGDGRTCVWFELADPAGGGRR